MAEFCIFDRPKLIQAKSNIVYTWAKEVLKELQRADHKGATWMIENIHQLSKEMGLSIGLEVTSYSAGYTDSDQNSYELFLRNLGSKQQIMMIEEDMENLTNTEETFENLIAYYESGCTGANNLAQAVSHSLQVQENTENGIEMMAFSPIAIRCLSMISKDDYKSLLAEDLSSHRKKLIPFGSQTPGEWRTYLENDKFRKALRENKFAITNEGLPKYEAGPLGYMAFLQNYDVFEAGSQKHETATLRGTELTIGTKIPESIIATIKGRPLEEIFSSPFTDGLNIEIDRMIIPYVPSPEETVIKIKFKKEFEVISLKNGQNINQFERQEKCQRVNDA